MTPSPQQILASARFVLLDMDGVLYRGGQPIAGGPEFLRYLDQTGRRWLCVTNFTGNTPAMFAQKLNKMGFHAQPENILGAAEATAIWLARQARPGARVFCLGMEGLRHALAQAAFELVDQPDAAEFVVAGIDFELTY